MKAKRPSPVRTCRICEHSGSHQTLKVREMMFGSNEAFPYMLCANCGCLQIVDIPEDMSNHYRPDYYSLASNPARLYRNPLVSLARRWRDHFAVSGKGWTGKWIHSLFPAEADLMSLREVPLSKQSSILDVGCGTGFLLYFLKEAGFEQVEGIDPYIDRDIEYDNGLNIQKLDIRDLENNWDLIMFHHSFEHVPDPLETLRLVARALKPGAWCLLRLPVVSSFAWETYGAHWVQLDAPRHFHLHSPKSICKLAAAVNLRLEKTVYDSNEIQFWGSEQYQKGIPLMSEESYGVNPEQSIFSRREIEDFKQRARRLNRESRGDQAAFYLQKAK